MMDALRITCPAAAWRDLAEDFGRPVDAAEVRADAQATIDHLGRVLGTRANERPADPQPRCHYCSRPDLYGPVPRSGCPCGYTPPAINGYEVHPSQTRARANDNDYERARQEARATGLISYHPGGRIISVR
jgi:hypothetical protein